jgi:hypothetical protein
MSLKQNLHLPLFVCDILFTCFFLSQPLAVYAADQQHCPNNNTCVVGEFLYDDSYSPITGAACTISSRYPDGSIFLSPSSTALTEGDDGWYSYTVNTNGKTNGIYPTQICCTSTDGKVCLDKSFIVENPSANSEDVSNIQSSLSSLSAKIDSLDSKISSISTSIDSLISKWGSFSAADIIGYVDTLETNLGSNSDTCATNNTVIGNLQCLREKWGSQTADNLYSLANTTTSSLSSLRTELDYNGKSSTAYTDIQTLKNNVLTLDTSISNATASIKGSDNKDLSQVSTAVGNVQTKVNSLPTVSEIWSYTGRTLTSFGSLVSDIWSYSGRTLSNFGTLVADVWTNTTRTLTGHQLGNGQELATVNSLSATVSAATASLKGTDNKNLTDISVENTVTQSQVSTIGAKIAVLPSASDIWSYSSRSLTSFGALVSDIWAYSNKSLDNFGNLISNVWSYQNRTLSNQTLGNGQELATVNSFGSTVSAATASIKGTDNRDLSYLSGQVAGVQTSLDNLSGQVSSLGVKTDSLSTSVNTLISKWGSYSISQVVNSLDSLETSLGSTSDSCSSGSTVFSSLQCLKEKWGTQTADNLLTSTNSLTSILSSLRTELDYNGKSTTAYTDIQNLKSNIDSVKSLVGNDSDTSSAATLFGKIKKNQETIASLNTSSTDVSGLLEKWGSYTATDIYDKVKDLSSNISSINTVSNVSSILDVTNTSKTDITELKNTVLSLQAIIEVNKTLLEKIDTQPIVKSWLEEGSVIFKTLITNPSSTQKQTVPIKFFLPKEANKTDIIKIDDNLSVDYDTNEGAYYVSGSFVLFPKETKIVSVEVNDIWKISDQEISSLKMQTEDLSSVLKNSSYFAQGITLKSDIISVLDMISRTQNEAITPQSRIKTYRDNQTRLSQIKTEVNELKNIVASSGTNNNLLGFVGGVQTVSSWGLIIIIISGFIFLSLYMRSIINENPDQQSNLDHPKKHSKLLLKNRYFHFFMVIAGFIVITIAATVTYKIITDKKTVSTLKNTYVDSAASPSTSSEASGSGINIQNPKDVLGDHTDTPANTLEIPAKISNINVRQDPSIYSPIVTKIKGGITVEKKQEIEDWIQINVATVSGWINKKVLQSN